MLRPLALCMKSGPNRWFSSAIKSGSVISPSYGPNDSLARSRSISMRRNAESLSNPSLRARLSRRLIRDCARQRLVFPAMRVSFLLAHESKIQFRRTGDLHEVLAFVIAPHDFDFDLERRYRVA